jgi:hypothetical protein
VQKIPAERLVRTMLIAVAERRAMLDAREA